ncbi:MAG: hypothetical protein ABJA93_03540 [Sporichthyaceae bacterium]
MPIARSSSITSRHRVFGTPVVGLAMILALGLTGCGAGDDATAPTPRKSATTRSAEPVSAGPTLITPAPETTTSRPTLPPGDPGDAPSVPENTSTIEEPRAAALTKVPVGALLDAKTVGEVLGGTWTTPGAPADSCSAPRPSRAVGTRSASLTGSGGTIIENVSTYNGTGDVSAVSALAKRLRACGWTQQPEPPIGEHSAELSRTGGSGVERVVVVTAEGVTVTVVGRGSFAANADDWSAIVDIANGTSCLATPDGCH